MKNKLVIVLYGFFGASCFARMSALHIAQQQQQQQPVQLQQLVQPHLNPDPFVAVLQQAAQNVAAAGVIINHNIQVLQPQHAPLWVMFNSNQLHNIHY